MRNTGSRHGREVVQIYLAPLTRVAGHVPAERPDRWLAGFATVEAAPGETAEAEIALPRRAFEIWDERSGTRRFIDGTYAIEAARSVTDRRLTARVTVA